MGASYLESDLTMTWAAVCAEIGHFLGYGRGSAYGDVAWTTPQQNDINSVLQSAQRRLYYQAQVSAADPIHNWSFLQPYAVIDLLQGAQNAALPPGFGGIEGEVTVSQANQTGYWPLPVVNPEIIVQNFAAFPTASGRPTIAAIQTQPPTGPYPTGAQVQSSKYFMMIYPMADLAYQLRFRFYFCPNGMNQNYIYHFGGAPHSETLKCAARAAAELFLDGEAGPEAAEYRTALAASIQYDRKLKPQQLGYNRDLSDRTSRAWGIGIPWWAYGRYGYGTITIDGQNPG